MNTTKDGKPLALGSTEGLGPCPCCGSAASFGTATGDDEGAYFVYCTNGACGLTTNLMFACMDDPKPLLAEKWNLRTERFRPALLQLLEDVHDLTADSESLEGVQMAAALGVRAGYP